MNALTFDKPVPSIEREYDAINEMDLKICKFFTIISKFKEIQENCNKQQLNYWINKKIAEMTINLNTGSKCKDFILGYFKIDKQDEKKYNLAGQYAPLIVDARPDNYGFLENINYGDLVYVVKKVFKKHITENKEFFNNGIILNYKYTSYCAINSNNRVYIFSNFHPPRLGEGSNGIIYKVYNLFAKEFLAYKVSKTDKNSSDLLDREIKNLEELHTNQAGAIKGIQDRPLAVLSFDKEKGYLMPIADYDLNVWSKKPHSRTERVQVCLEVLQILKKVSALRFWHGDIKPENILKTVHNQFTLVDWAGSCSFNDVIDKKLFPGNMSRGYICLKDLREFKVSQYLLEKSKYDNMIQTIELFAVSVVLFQILVPEIEWPFSVCIRDGNLAINTEEGMTQEACHALSKKKYSKEIIQTIKKMLSHDSKDRYNLDDAIAVWENIIVTNSI